MNRYIWRLILFLLSIHWPLFEVGEARLPIGSLIMNNFGSIRLNLLFISLRRAFFIVEGRRTSFSAEDIGWLWLLIIITVRVIKSWSHWHIMRLFCAFATFLEFTSLLIGWRSIYGTNCIYILSDSRLLILLSFMCIIEELLKVIRLCHLLCSCKRRFVINQLRVLILYSHFISSAPTYPIINSP